MLKAKDLGAFKEWLVRDGCNTKQGAGPFEALQVQIRDQWVCLVRVPRSGDFTSSSKTLRALIARFNKDQASQDDPHLCPRCKAILRRALEQLL